MSNYTDNLGASLQRALAGVPRAQPAQIAGYWANREFWLAEFEHLLAVIDGFDERLERMRLAYDQYAQRYGGEHNTDEFGVPRQRPRDRASPSQRRDDASDARTSLKALCEWPGCNFPRSTKNEIERAGAYRELLQGAGRFDSRELFAAAQ